MIRKLLRKIMIGVFEEEWNLLDKVYKEKINRESKLFNEGVASLEKKYEAVSQQQKTMLADLASGERFIRGKKGVVSLSTIAGNLRTIIEQGIPMTVNNVFKGVDFTKEEAIIANGAVTRWPGRPPGSKNKKKVSARKK